ncbi:MAG: hypothetical protein ACI4W6_07670 [Acutalibacteraceae bacterium]
MSDDTIHLLKECDSGTKTAVNSIREVLDNVKDDELLKLLTDSIKKHEKIGDETHEMLSSLGESEKEPSAMARAASWLKINAKLMEDPSDQTIAALMTDGCNMGIKQISIYKNKYPAADKKAKQLAQKLVSQEQSLLDDLRKYL